MPTSPRRITKSIIEKKGLDSRSFTSFRFTQAALQIYCINVTFQGPDFDVRRNYISGASETSAGFDNEHHRFLSLPAFGLDRCVLLRIVEGQRLGLGWKLKHASYWERRLIAFKTLVVLSLRPFFYAPRLVGWSSLYAISRRCRHPR